MGGGNHLPSSDTIARLPSIPYKQNKKKIVKRMFYTVKSIILSFEPLTKNWVIILLTQFPNVFILARSMPTSYLRTPRLPQPAEGMYLPTSSKEHCFFLILSAVATLIDMPSSKNSTSVLQQRNTVQNWDCIADVIWYRNIFVYGKLCRFPIRWCRGFIVDHDLVLFFTNFQYMYVNTQVGNIYTHTRKIMRI